jgi:hypothetical protein
MTAGNQEPTRLDRAITAVYFGFFGLGWFGWAQSAPPSWLRPWLYLGTALAGCALIAGVVVAFLSRRQPTATRDRAAFRRYGVIVGVEFAVAIAAAAVLGGSGRADFIPVAVCAVVGLHFFPLAPVLGDQRLKPLGAAFCGWRRPPWSRRSPRTSPPAPSRAPGPAGSSAATRSSASRHAPQHTGPIAERICPE